MASPSLAEHGSSVLVCCSTIQLMLCCPPWQAFPQATSLCRLLLLGIVRWAILLYVPHLLWERHLCLVLMLPQVDLLLHMSGLPSSPSLLFGSSVPSKVFVLLLCLIGHLLWVWVIRLLFRADDQDHSVLTRIFPWGVPGPPLLRNRGPVRTLGG